MSGAPERFAPLLADLDAVTGLMRVLSNPDRLAILCYLVEREASVSDIGAALNLRQPGLSQQLGDLRAHHLVKTRRHSRQVYYSVESLKVVTVLEALNATWVGKTAPPSQTKHADRANMVQEAAQFARVAHVASE